MGLLWRVHVIMNGPGQIGSELSESSYMSDHGLL